MRISDWSSDVCSSVRLAEQLARTRIGEHEAVFVDQPGLVFDPHLPRLPGNVLEDAFAQRTGQGRTFEAFGVDAELDAVNGAAHEFVLDGSESIILRIEVGRASWRERVCQYV